MLNEIQTKKQPNGEKFLKHVFIHLWKVLLISLILNEQAQHQANDNKYYFQKINSENQIENDEIKINERTRNK